MEITWYPVLYLFSIIIIKGCKGIQEKEYKNLLSPKNLDDYYLPLDISSYNIVDRFYIISSEINGVDSLIFLPRPKVKIGEILDKDTSLWQRRKDEKFILGIISTRNDVNTFLINLVIQCETGIRHVLYQNKGKYEMVRPSQYLDTLSQLRVSVPLNSFTLDLGKNEISEVLDHSVKIAHYRANLFIPHRGNIANKVVFAENNIYDGSGQYHIPVAIGYESAGETYLNIFVSRIGEDVGNIYKYQLVGVNFKFIYKSDVRPIYDIFTHRLGSLSTTSYKDMALEPRPTTGPRVTPSTFPDIAPKRKRKDSDINIYDIEVPRISVDLENIDTQFLRVETHTLPNLGTKTIKYLPLGSIITSVTYSDNEIWSLSDTEVKCLQISIHSVNGIKQVIELTILKNAGNIISRTIPYDSIVQSVDSVQEVEKSEEETSFIPVNPDFEDDDEHIDEKNEDDYVKNKEAKERMKPNSKSSVPTDETKRSGTPPPSPYKPINNSESSNNGPLKSQTPPNSPARTPPPSPNASRSNSICEEHQSELEDEVIYEFLKDFDTDSIFSDRSTLEYLDDLDDYDLFEDEPYDYLEEDITDDYNVFTHTSDHNDAIAEDERYSKEYIHLYEGDHELMGHIKPRALSVNFSLDIASKTSWKKLLVVDGRKHVPFVFMFPLPGTSIRSIFEGEQNIWHTRTPTEVLKSISLYFKDGQPTVMALIIVEEPKFRNKYFIKRHETWYEISLMEYLKNTPHEFKKPEFKEIKPEPKTEEKKKRDTVIRVSIMVPVVLGTLFLVVWVCAMLFILFFC